MPTTLQTAVTGKAASARSCLLWDQACAEGHAVRPPQASLGGKRPRQAVQCKGEWPTSDLRQSTCPDQAAMCSGVRKCLSFSSTAAPAACGSLVQASALDTGLGYSAQHLRHVCAELNAATEAAAS